MSTELEQTGTTRGDLDGAEVSSRTPWLAAAAAALVLMGVAWWYLGRHAAATAPERPAPVEPPAASFTEVAGNVRFKAGGDFQWREAALESPLRESDLVRTGVRSTADITFVDTTLVSVRPESLITIQRPGAGSAEAASHRAASWHISSGEVNFQRQVAEGSAEVSTPTVRSTISELASANIRVEASGDSDIRLFAGRGRVETTAGESVDLSENEGLRVDAEGHAGPKLQLPDAPALSAPADGAALPEAVPPREPLGLSWRAVPDVAGYRVVVAAEPGFAEAIVDRSGIAATGLELPRLPTGRYFWRVAAVSDAGAESAFSPARGFEIVPAPTGPALEVRSLEVRGNIAQIQGRTVPGARVTVNGYDVPVQADGSFDEFVTLLQSGRQTLVIRAVAPDGGVSQLERPVAAGR